jgi:EF hand
MQKHVLMLTTSAFILVCGVIAASAQQPGTTQEKGEGGHGMMRHGMMGQQGIMSPFFMRVIFALMDADGDGTVSLQEFQQAHERLFKAMDTDHDGTLSLEEMEAFMHGSKRPAPQH